MGLQKGEKRLVRRRRRRNRAFVYVHWRIQKKSLAKIPVY